MFSQVNLIGNLTTDPELRYTQNGTAVTDLRMAINNRVGGKEESIFIDVTVWDKSAVTCCEYLKKGRQVFVSGRLKDDSWVDQEGKKRNRIRVVANEVKFLGSPKTEKAEKEDTEHYSEEEVQELDIPF